MSENQQQEHFIFQTTDSNICIYSDNMCLKLFQNWQETEWWVWLLLSLPILYIILIVSYIRKMIHKDLKFLEKPLVNLDEKYKPFQRIDRQNWNFFEIYFCAIFLLPIRLVFIVVSFVFLSSFNSLIMLFGDREAEQSWLKRNFIKVIYKLCTRTWLIGFGFYWISKKKLKIQDFDETYPWQDYEHLHKDKKKKYPLLVCNHIGYTDTMYMTNQEVPSLTAKHEVQNIPVLGNTGSAIQCIFINRLDREHKDGVINKIKQRCDLIKKGKRYPPLLLFPEGTTSNGKYVLSFKKGAFAPFEPIKIYALKIKQRGISHYLDENVSYAQHFILTLCNFYYSMTAYEFETFYPDHLNLKEESDWEIYAQKVQQLMSQAIDAEISDSGYRHCIEYEKLVEDYRHSNNVSEQQNSENENQQSQTQSKSINNSVPDTNDIESLKQTLISNEYKESDSQQIQQKQRINNENQNQQNYGTL